MMRVNVHILKIQEFMNPISHKWRDERRKRCDGMDAGRIQFKFLKKGAAVNRETSGMQDVFNVHLDRDDETPEVNDHQAYTVACDGAIFIGVGNQLSQGIIDHQHADDSFLKEGTGLNSSSSLIYAYPSLMEDVRSKAKSSVTIFLHKTPDFDSYVAAYLTRHYIIHGEFPEFSDLLVNYADEVNQGYKLISKQHPVSLYTLAQSISNPSMSNENDKAYKEKLSDEEFSMLSLNQGLELIDFAIKRLKELDPKERNLDSPVFIGRDHPFTEQEQLIKDDYQKYLEDRDQGKTEVRSLLLPTIDGSVREVDALFWRNVPSCELHKLWARTDKESPHKDGFIFTSIPLRINPDPEKSNRYIISVRPYDGVHLKGLAQLLERKELVIEEADIFPDGKRRNRREVRYENESWCENDDPWYDGRKHDYTMVVSPRRGTFLTLDEVEPLVWQFQVPTVLEGQTDIILPFEFEDQKYEQMTAEFASITNIKQIDHSIPDYFRPYIQDYLFKNKQAFRHDHLGFCAAFEFTENDKGQKYSLILFKYGIGIVIAEKLNWINRDYEMPLDMFIKNNFQLENKIQEGLENHHFEEVELTNMIAKLKECDANLILDQPLLYTNVILDRERFNPAFKEEAIYKLCMNIAWDELFDANSKEIREALNDVYYDYNEQTIYGFSKKGSSFVYLEETSNLLPATKIEEMEVMKTTLLEQYNRVEFYIFILALHQRYALMHFSRDLSHLGGKGKYKDISKLRSNVLEFIVQGWFSQITNNEAGMKRYERWEKIFANDKLHDEVLNQVSTVDNYYKSIMSNKIENISGIFMPLILLNVFMGIGVIQLSAWLSFNDAFSWLIAFGFLIGFGLIAVVYIKEWHRPLMKKIPMVKWKSRRSEK